MKTENTLSKGLTTAEAKKRLEEYGKNQLVPQKKTRGFQKVLHALSEPMFLLLITAAVIYFMLGEPRDGLVMLVFVVGIIGIDVVQEWKTDRTLEALKELSAPQITVLRDGAETVIFSTELVPGDLMMVHEGIKVPADGLIIKCSDLCLDESSLTGEAEGIWKTETSETPPSDDYWRKDYCYAGTLVTQGTGTILVEKTGPATAYGKIGKSIAEVVEGPTPLQRQTRTLVKACVGIAGVLFLLVCTVTWFNLSDVVFYDRLTGSILSGITLAMAMIPEEFPVILTVFLSMGAWRLAKKHSLVRRLPSVETLGAVSVLCVDKTGTITINQMTVQEVWSSSPEQEILCEVMGLACETDAYDPMEQALLAYCQKKGIEKSHLFGGEMIQEYAFTNELKMMGHVWHHDEEIIIAAKGSPESIFTLCHLSVEERRVVENQLRLMGNQGLRVIAVAWAKPEQKDDIPAEITDCHLTLLGLVGLADPPRENISRDIALCSKAGIRTVMITGDNGVTAAAIAKKIGIPHHETIITGDQMERMSDEELQEKVKWTNIFSRVIPEQKMRIIKALKENGEVVAMTGDGVNDAPALKYADIGIAMGKRGSEVAREAADLILMDDHFTTIVDTIKDGRRIYDNIRKAVGYVFAIHIPIAAASLLAPLWGIAPEHLLFLPLHVVLFELIVDPTCSVVLERQPAEQEIMARPPRDPREKLLNSRLLLKSILQGTAIFLATFGIYVHALWQSPDNGPTARSMGLAVIMLANLFLVLVNSSDYNSILRSIKILAKDKVMWAVSLITLTGLAVILYSPLQKFLKLASLSLLQVLTVFGLAAASVLWYELVKWTIRKKKYLLSH